MGNPGDRITTQGGINGIVMNMPTPVGEEYIIPFIEEWRMDMVK